eukprot:m.124457 g.124457  ORF g.124457 m.124457 type:complete len:301 (-) comp9347_c0_seq2:30-932(-)
MLLVSSDPGTASWSVDDVRDLSPENSVMRGGIRLFRMLTVTRRAGLGDTRAALRCLSSSASSNLMGSEIWFESPMLVVEQRTTLSMTPTLARTPSMIPTAPRSLMSFPSMKSFCRALLLLIASPKQHAPSSLIMLLESSSRRRVVFVTRASARRLAPESSMRLLARFRTTSALLILRLPAMSIAPLLLIEFSFKLRSAKVRFVQSPSASSRRPSSSMSQTSRHKRTRHVLVFKQRPTARAAMFPQYCSVQSISEVPLSFLRSFTMSPSTIGLNWSSAPPAMAQVNRQRQLKISTVSFPTW